VQVLSTCAFRVGSGHSPSAGEESLCRGLPQPRLRRRLTTPSAIAIMSVLFALVHGYRCSTRPCWPPVWSQELYGHRRLVTGRIDPYRWASLERRRRGEGVQFATCWLRTLADPPKLDRRTPEVAMTLHQIASPVYHQAMVGTAASAHASRPLTNDDGWTVQRLEVINDAAGICARCGLTGSDTAVRGWAGDQLVAAHTRCVVGLGPPRPETNRAA
jgi:Type II CAAX prenyl endopeptidase Rce1-like